MYFAPQQLKHTRGQVFYKFLASGRGFSPKPDFSTYCLLQTWETPHHAQSFFTENKWYRSVHKKSAHTLQVQGQCTRSRGAWDGASPFKADENAEPETKLLVLTRATVRTNKIMDFWKFVPKSHPPLKDIGGLLFSRGVGERPFSRMATISVWTNETSMKEFAHGHAGHREAMKQKAKQGWYREELFARFRVQQISGTWPNFSNERLTINR